MTTTPTFVHISYVIINIMRSNSYENGPNVPSLIIAFTISNGMLAKLVIHLVTLVMTGCTVDSTTHGTSMTLHKKSFPYTGRPICWLLYSIINARNVCSIYDTIIKLIFYDAYILRAQKGLLLIVDKFVTFGARLGMLE